MNANVERLITPLKIDISTGDVITPRAIEFNYDLLLEDRSISLWSYNLETILAEKLQTVLARGILNTRMRDFYDIRMLLDTYRSVKEALSSGKLVLFSGTGCQVNGLKSFLGKDYENLICVDVICHGAPSPALWKKYAIYQEQTNGGKLKGINFRCKDDSWTDFGMKEICKSMQ